MTKHLIIFSSDGSHVQAIQDYTDAFDANLASSGIKYKVVEYDATTQYYWGDFATGGLRNTHEQPLLEEIAIDELTNKEILIKYPVHTQLNIIAECLQRAGIPLTAEFTEMKTWIDQKVSNHNQAISTYAANPDIYSFWPKPPKPVDE